MKKIFSFLVLLAGITMFTSCSDDSCSSYTPTEPLPIAKTDVLFSAAGGDGSIVVNSASILHATTDAKWLSLMVSGNKVTVTAEPNTSLEGRSAKIVVTADDGATTNVIATQYGLLLALDAQNSYVFNSLDTDPLVIADKSNVDYSLAVSDDWIHIEKSAEGYAVTVEPNEGNYRNGTITLSFPAAEFVKTIRIVQWGKLYPFNELNTATYEDENGNSYTKDIQVVEDGAGHWLVKGLIAEGDIAIYAGNDEEFYIPAGYKPGTLTERGVTYTLHCIMSAYRVNNGNRYYPTVNNTGATNAYRMAFNWGMDEDSNIYCGYVQNANLSSLYSTDGVLVCKYNHETSLSTTYMVGTAYTFINLKLYAK